LRRQENAGPRHWPRARRLHSPQIQTGGCNRCERHGVFSSRAAAKPVNSESVYKLTKHRVRDRRIGGSSSRRSAALELVPSPPAEVRIRSRLDLLERAQALRRQEGKRGVKFQRVAESWPQPLRSRPVVPIQSVRPAGSCHKPHVFALALHLEVASAGGGQFQLQCEDQASVRSRVCHIEHIAGTRSLRLRTNAARHRGYRLAGRFANWRWTGDLPSTTRKLCQRSTIFPDRLSSLNWKRRRSDPIT